jgi:pyruvate carboxylase
MTSQAARFEKVAATPYPPLEKMEKRLLYTIANAERVNSVHGPTVQFLVEDRGKQYFIHLPQRCQGRTGR